MKITDNLLHNQSYMFSEDLYQEKLLEVEKYDTIMNNDKIPKTLFFGVFFVTATSVILLTEIQSIVFRICYCLGIILSIVIYYEWKKSPQYKSVIRNRAQKVLELKEKLYYYEGLVIYLIPPFR